MTQPAAWTWIARIRRTQGRKGEVFAEILTDFPERFADRKQLWLLGDPAAPAGKRTGSGEPVCPQEVELASHWLHKGGIVLHFAGVDSISAAEELLGLVVAIPKAERATLAEDEAYVSDLVGCALIDVAGPEAMLVGEIEGVDRSAGPVPLLIVRGSRTHPEEILIPFAKDYLRRLDLEAKRVEMALPEGLIGMNVPE